MFCHESVVSLRRMAMSNRQSSLLCISFCCGHWQCNGRSDSAIFHLAEHCDCCACSSDHASSSGALVRSTPHGKRASKNGCLPSSKEKHSQVGMPFCLDCFPGVFCPDVRLDGFVPYHQLPSRCVDSLGEPTLLVSTSTTSLNIYKYASGTCQMPFTSSSS